MTVAVPVPPVGGRTVEQPTGTPSRDPTSRGLRPARTPISSTDSGDVGMIRLWMRCQSRTAASPPASRTFSNRSSDTGVLVDELVEQLEGVVRLVVVAEVPVVADDLGTSQALEHGTPLPVVA